MMNTNNTTSSPRAGYSIAEIATMLGIGRATFYRMKESSGFPEPSFYAGSRPRWTQAAIDNWIKEQH